jgi:hypothetical protein
VTVIELKEATGIKYAIRCACGFLGASRATLAAAGAEMDAHQAEVFPIGTQRRECNPLCLVCGHPASFHESLVPEVYECSDLYCLCSESPSDIYAELARTVNSDSPDSGKGEGGAK